MNVAPLDFGGWGFGFGGKWIPLPPEPIFDPNAMNGESYGRIRIFVASLRNHFEHDIKKWEEWQRQNNKRQRDSFFKHAIDKPAPEKHQDYSSLDYLRATLFALKDTIGYLEAVRERRTSRADPTSSFPVTMQWA